MSNVSPAVGTTAHINLEGLKMNSRMEGKSLPAVGTTVDSLATACRAREAFNFRSGALLPCGRRLRVAT